MNQSFQRVFVTNNATVLTSGTTTDLAVNQVGIFDGETYQATTTPTYFKNKSIIFGWGYPDRGNAALMDGTFNQNELTEQISGRSIKRVRVKRAVHGRSEIVTVGNSGSVSDTDTLTVAPGQSKSFYLRLTGAPIDRLYSTQGFLKRYVVEGPCIDDCADGCASATDDRAVAENLAKQINKDTKFKGLVRASVITQCTPSISIDTINAYEFQVVIADDGSDESLGYVQSQYPGLTVTRASRSGIYSTYQIVRSANTTPGAFSNAGLTIIPNCATCPAGYTLVVSGFVYEIKRADAGGSTQLTAINTDYGISGSETSARISYQDGVSTYIIVSSAAATVSGTDAFKFIGLKTNSCVLTTPVTTAWALTATLIKYPKTYNITLADDVCGDDRLTALQAAFPDLTVSLLDDSGECAHTYKTTVYSQAVDNTCSVDTLDFTAPDAFEGVAWVAKSADALPDGTTCVVGVKLESAWVDRVTNTCTYGYYPYEADGVHIEISEFDPNYNGDPEKCKLTSTSVKTIQSIVYPQGVGSYVRKQEEKSKGYFLKFFPYDPIRREVEGYSFAADPAKYYDEVVVEYSKSYPVGSFSTAYTDSEHLHIYVAEGLGQNLVTAINSYITSPEIGADAVNY